METPPGRDAGAASGGADGPPRSVGRRHRPGDAVNLRDAWRRNAQEWIAWARTPMHDSYWRFHRDQFLSLLPQPRGLTLDVGAGEGRLARDLRRRGHEVVALDASPALALAAGATDAATRPVVADATAVPLRDGAFGLVVAFMSLQDIDDLHGVVREMRRVLTPGGRLCAAIVHPLNSAGRFDGEAADAGFVIDSAYLEASPYVDEIRRAGLRMTFASIHRPLEQYADALGDAGFLLERLREPAMPEHAVRAPRDRRWQRVPLFLHLRAIRVPP